MAHISSVPREQLAEFEPFFQQFEQMAGFVPNSLLTMAHRPELLKGYLALGRGALMSGTLDMRLKRLVALVASTAAGCRYCQAHMAIFSKALGAQPEDIERVWQFEFDEHFSPAERAALRLARDGGQVPNQVTAANFDELRQFYDDGEIAELVGVIATFGFLNRWNDTLATELEAAPLQVAEESFGKQGWDPGKHQPG